MQGQEHREAVARSGLRRNQRQVSQEAREKQDAEGEKGVGLNQHAIRICAAVVGEGRQIVEEPELDEQHGGRQTS